MLTTKRMAFAGCMLLAGFSGFSASLPGAEREPITQVEIGKNREFRVNGKPFFPIMSWAQDARHYDQLPDVGFNVHCGTADPDAAAKSGCYAIAAFNSAWTKNSNLLAWIHGDEPDMPKGKTEDPRHSPEDLAADYKKIKDTDSSRPVLVTFTGNFTREGSSYKADVRAQIYSSYVKACDVAGFDIYPIYGSGFPSRLNHVAEGVSQLCELTGPKKPVYAWIETSKGSKWMTYEKQPDVLPKHTRAEVWMAIIRGATGIGYFTHAWRPTFKEFAPTAEMQQEMKRLNTQITRLAPAILADPAQSKVEIDLGGLASHLKATQYDGSLWIFAQNIDLGLGAERLGQFEPIHPREGNATIKVAGLKPGVEIEVVDENRTLKAEDGAFKDAFAPLSEHIYRVPLAK